MPSTPKTKTTPWKIRDATALPRDVEFLELMLCEAAQWRPGDKARPTSEPLADPNVGHYITGWPQPGDFGLIADTVAGEPIGAAWCRKLTRLDPGYGYVDDDTPEVVIAVDGAWRHLGVGTALLGGLIDQAARRGLPSISLSVETDNPALNLYSRMGVAPTEASDNAVTMIRLLSPSGER